MGRGVLLHTYITYGERLGATRGLHIHPRDFKPSDPAAAKHTDS